MIGDKGLERSLFGINQMVAHIAGRLFQIAFCEFRENAHMLVQSHFQPVIGAAAAEYAEPVVLIMQVVVKAQEIVIGTLIDQTHMKRMICLIDGHIFFLNLVFFQT